MRELNEAHDTKLKQRIGIEKKSKVLTKNQQVMLDAAKYLIKSADLSLSDATKQWSKE